MPSEEEKVMATIAAGGDNGVFAFMQMARRFYNRDGEQGLKDFIEQAFATMPKAAQSSTVAVVLGELFFFKQEEFELILRLDRIFWSYEIQNSPCR